MEICIIGDFNMVEHGRPREVETYGSPLIASSFLPLTVNYFFLE